MSAEIKPFPTTDDELKSDVRVYFSKVEGKHLLEDEDGQDWELNEGYTWIPKKTMVDEERVRQFQSVYASGGLNEVDEERRVKPKKAPKTEQPRIEKPNCAIYITSLPLDATEEEVATEFSRYGVIAVATESGHARVKLYNDEDGNFKGDALVVYHRPESVQLAIQMADDADFRIGQKGPPAIIHVTVADTTYKKQKERTAKVGKEKRKIVNNLQKLNAKLTDWDDDEPSTIPKAASKYDKMVVLKHMFTLHELATDPSAAQEIKEDIMEECEEKFKGLGTVANVTLFDQEAEGVVTVRFSTVEAANACVKVMNGRNFDGRVVEASIATGEEKFKKTIEKRDDVEEERRLAMFGDSLEEDFK
ncbi:putative nuclear mRNA splicing factor-associated protein [Mytilinidion resinicola]|uniref:Nuclear mRNA splicing factor-associated protein n=1 Tax=Mytilinidion resinicola TaxID=574789 RepID=A0A6A6YWV1_9PEZI|nr:putative nuclear mRNA splicing factor-associated protein [Mytilinidion resinicola]KAF2813406.1 putative nuclear mRNA splicing factor-associated protein [Mytilinidion resinicola]